MVIPALWASRDAFIAASVSSGSWLLPRLNGNVGTPSVRKSKTFLVWGRGALSAPGSPASSTTERWTAAAKFVAPLTFEALTGHPVYSEQFDTPSAHRMEHIEWARWADAVIVAPASTADIGSAGSTSASRQTYMSGAAVEKACRAVADRVKESVAEREGLAADRLGVRDGRIVSTDGAIDVSGAGSSLTMRSRWRLR